MPSPRVATVKRFFTVSGNVCAFPGCERPLVDPASGTVIGRIYHIRARSPNGPRHDPDRSERDRYAVENLVLMCPTHHDVIDADPETYTIEEPQRIKRGHEARQASVAEPSDHIARRFLIHVQVDGPVSPGQEDALDARWSQGFANRLRGPVDVHIGDRYYQRVTLTPLPSPRIPLQRTRRAEHFVGRTRQLAQILDELRSGHSSARDCQVAESIGG